MVLGHGQHVVVPDHREIGEPENSPDLGRTKHLPQRLLDSLLGTADVATESGKPAARGVENFAAVVEASLDGDGETRELAHFLP